MGFFDYVSSLGQKVMNGDVAGVGQKLWSGANSLGEKASGLAHTVVDSDLGKAAIGAIAGPEAIPMAMGALASFDEGLSVSKSGQGQLDDWLKPAKKAEKPERPKTAPRPQAMIGYAGAPPLPPRRVVGYAGAPPLPPRRVVAPPLPPRRGGANSGNMNTPAPFLPVSLRPRPLPKSDLAKKMTEQIRKANMASKAVVYNPPITPAAATSLRRGRK